MKKRNHIEELFVRLKNEFDVEEPRPQHQERFLEKLHNQEKKHVFARSKKRSYKGLISIAASIAIIVTVLFATQMEPSKTGLASVSSEMKKTQHFYTSAIAAKLRKIEKQQDPKTLPLVQDAMLQLEILEKEYVQLQKDLVKSGNDNRVIFAMIENFQRRINVLQNVLKQIEIVKQLKQNENENLPII